jgi:hypothetical protein
MYCSKTVIMYYKYRYFKSWLKLILTINIPVVYMARYIMILMRANPLQGTLEGVGPENRDFFGNGFAPIKIIKSKANAFWAPKEKSSN